MSDDELLELAGRLADGQELRWEQAEATAAREGREPELQGLRVLAALCAALGPPAHDAENATPRSWGPLELRGRIGAGSFGEIFRAYDPRLLREVALKLLRGQPAGAEARALGEAQRLARVRHPNVIVVHGAEEHEGRPGLWMELVPGRTLAEELSASGPLDVRATALVGVELCRALTAVHGAGLIHEDLKAGNVMREPGGRIVLMDFGAGALAPGLTPLYAAPELLGGERPDARSDIYALGVLLFHLVTGEYPLLGESLETLRAAHSRGARRRLGALRPDLPERFVDVVERALAPRDQRYRNAAAMESALARCLRAIDSPSRPRRMVLGGAAVLGALGLAVLVFRAGTPPRPVAPSASASAAAPAPASSATPQVPETTTTPAPAAAASATPAAPPATTAPSPLAIEPSAASLDPAVAALETSLSALAPAAARWRALHETHARLCSGTRRVERRNPTDDSVVTVFVPNEELPECRAEALELRQIENRLHLGVTQAEDDARRARVLPGTVRALRERYGLDSNRWDFP